MSSRPTDFAGAPDEPVDKRAASPHRRRSTGIWLHIGAGAVLVVVMAVAALYVMSA
jgi:hypothetical protein